MRDQLLSEFPMLRGFLMSCTCESCGIEILTRRYGVQVAEAWQIIQGTDQPTAAT